MKKAAATLLTLMLSSGVCSAQTLSGLDVLQRDGFAQLQGKRVGLITNHTSVNRAGANAVDVLHAAPGVRLAAIFSPEHGFRGTEEGGVYIESSTDPATGVPVYSLYGKGKQRPAPEMLKDLDVLVFDIQDIGARFYTYLTTMGYAMEEAAKAGLPFMVLDRPNPIGGKVEGPVLASDISAFTAYFPVPTRHGFTAGEMAMFHRDNLKLALDLSVVKLEGWNRRMFFDATGLPWTNPSPNIRTVDAEVLYPGLGCFEASNVSVGRGTDIPFEWFGAPWMKAEKIAKKLNRAGLRGVKFSMLTLTPAKDMYEGKASPGVKIEVTDRAAVDALEVFTHASYWLKKYNGKDFRLKEAEIRKMTGSSHLYDLLGKGKKPAKIIEAFQKDNKGFREAASKYRLYK
ncbi:MAG: exo-beta-N-acetylmuramidase NamZ domain-containing protein [Elusimicrobiales bacterium]